MGTANEKGVTFGPTKTERFYDSLNCHRPTSKKPEKTKWCIDRQGEYAIFENADSASRTCIKGHIWGFGNQAGTIVLGGGNEVLAKFPKVVNPNDNWHGYPVSPRSKPSDAPPKEDIKQWLANGDIEQVFARRLLRFEL